MLATVSTSLNKFADNEVELRRVGGVYAPIGSRDPVYNSAANGIEVGHDTSRVTLHAACL